MLIYKDIFFFMLVFLSVLIFFWNFANTHLFVFLMLAYKLDFALFQMFAVLLRLWIFVIVFVLFIFLFKLVGEAKELNVFCNLVYCYSVHLVRLFAQVLF